MDFLQETISQTFQGLTLITISSCEASQQQTVATEILSKRFMSLSINKFNKPLRMFPLEVYVCVSRYLLSRDDVLSSNSPLSLTCLSLSLSLQKLTFITLSSTDYNILTISFHRLSFIWNLYLKRALYFRVRGKRM